MVYDVRPISQKWFAEATPTNYVVASATLGTGTDGVITVNYDDGITTDTVIVAVIATGANKPMGAALANGKITISLGTGADSNVAAAKNTAKLIADAISLIPGFTAIYSGTGATSISEATTEDVAFADGHLGTPCMASNIILQDTSYWYISTKADNTEYNDGWLRFTPATY